MYDFHRFSGSVRLGCRAAAGCSQVSEKRGIRPSARLVPEQAPRVPDREDRAASVPGPAPRVFVPVVAIPLAPPERSRSRVRSDSGRFLAECRTYRGEDDGGRLEQGCVSPAAWEGVDSRGPPRAKSPGSRVQAGCQVTGQGSTLRPFRQAVMGTTVAAQGPVCPLAHAARRDQGKARTCGGVRFVPCVRRWPGRCRCRTSR